MPYSNTASRMSSVSTPILFGDLPDKRPANRQWRTRRRQAGRPARRPRNQRPAPVGRSARCRSARRRPTRPRRRAGPPTPYRDQARPDQPGRQDDPETPALPEMVRERPPVVQQMQHDRAREHETRQFVTELERAFGRPRVGRPRCRASVGCRGRSEVGQTCQILRAHQVDRALGGADRLLQPEAPFLLVSVGHHRVLDLLQRIEHGAFVVHQRLGRSRLLDVDPAANTAAVEQIPDVSRRRTRSCRRARKRG